MSKNGILAWKAIKTLLEAVCKENRSGLKRLRVYFMRIMNGLLSLAFILISFSVVAVPPNFIDKSREEDEPRPVAHQPLPKGYGIPLISGDIHRWNWKIPQATKETQSLCIALLPSIVTGSRIVHFKGKMYKIPPYLD